MKIYKQLRDLPEELEKWGVKALSKIESPEKANQAATDLREKIDMLWDECPASEDGDKVYYILKQFGKADVAADELKQTYALKSNTKADKIVGIICLVLAGLCSIYPIQAFFIHPQLVMENQGVVHGIWQAGKGAGAGVVCVIIFLILGVRLLVQNKKNEE